MSEILSPTPPVECLSTVGRERPCRSSRSPEAIIRSVHVRSSWGPIPLRKMAISSDDICSSATSSRAYASNSQVMASSLRGPPSRFAVMTSIAE